MKFIALLIFFFILFDISLSLINKRHFLSQKIYQHNKRKTNLNSKNLVRSNNNRNNSNKSAVGKSIIEDKILKLVDSIEKESISLIDKKFLLSKGKVENLQKLTEDKIKEIDQAPLEKIEKYLSAIPMLNSNSDRKPNAKTESVKNENENEINFSADKQKNNGINNVNIQRDNYPRNKYALRSDIKDDNSHQKQIKESIFNYLNSKKKGSSGGRKGSNNTNINKSRNRKTPKDWFRNSVKSNLNFIKSFI